MMYAIFATIATQRPDMTALKSELGEHHVRVLCTSYLGNLDRVGTQS